MIAVQLLATCFTLPPESERCSRPPASYYDRNCLIGHSANPRLISSLRLHTQFQTSPALGHNARNSSPALAWRGCRYPPLLEDRLAEEISRQRRLQQLERPNQLRKDPTSRRGWSDEPSNEMERNSGCAIPPTSLRRRNQSSTEIETPPSQRRNIDRIYGRPRRSDDLPTCPLSHTSQSRGTRPGWGDSRGNTVRSHKWAHVKTYSHRWSLQPVLQSEDHPVFIQPVKEHIIRRSKEVGSWSRRVSSTARLDKNFVGPRRKQGKISDDSSTGSLLSTSGPNTESSINDAGPVSLSAPSPEVVESTLPPGIGADQAASIDYRTLNGPFQRHDRKPTVIRSYSR